MRAIPKVDQLKLSLDQLKHFSSMLTPGTVLREATLQALTEWEQRARAAEQSRSMRVRHWD